MLKQTNLAARFCKNQVKGQVFNVLPNKWQLGHGDLYFINCWEESQVSPYQFSMAYKMRFGFQFNLSESSDDDLYRLDLDPEGQGHQWKMK